MLSSKSRNKRLYENIRKVANNQGDNYTSGYLLDYPSLKEIYLSKQQALVTDPKAIQQGKFAGNIDRAKSKTVSFGIEEAKSYLFAFSLI